MTTVKLTAALANAANLIDEIAVKADTDLTITTSANKTIVQSQPTWRDEYVGGDWGDATGNASPSFSSFTIGGIAYRKLTLDANDARTNVFEIPHDMVYSTDAALQPEVHAHIRPTTNDTGTIILYLEPEWSKTNTTNQATVNDPVALAEMSVTITIVSGSANYPHYVATFGNLPVNEYRIGDMIGFKVSRRTGFGTYTADIILEKVALHVPCDTAGSRQIYVK